MQLLNHHPRTSPTRFDAPRLANALRLANAPPPTLTALGSFAIGAPREARRSGTLIQGLPRFLLLHMPPLPFLLHCLLPPPLLCPLFFPYPSQLVCPLRNLCICSVA